MTLEILAVFLTALAVAASATPAVRMVARRYGLVVAPRADRWHTQLTALWGGIGIALGAAAGLAALAVLLPRGLPGHGEALAIVAGAALLALVGMVDDARGMGPITKAAFQLGAAVLVVAAGVVIPLTPWGPANVAVTLFWFVGITNALNLLDNMDGVTAGVSAVAASGFALLFAAAGDFVLAGVALAVAGAAAGFLIFNFKPASIFMGDAGSLLLGGALAGLGAAYPAAHGTGGPMALLVPTLLLLVPVVDTTLVTVTRTLYGRRVTMGGRDHVTHRLVAMGLTEAGAALFLYGCGAAALATAWAASNAVAEVGIWMGIVFLAAAMLFAGYLSTLYRYEDGPAGEVVRRGVIVRNLLVERRGLELLLDVVLFGLAFYGAFIIYYDIPFPPQKAAVATAALLPAIAIKLLAFHHARVYQGMWHRAELADVHRVVKATVYAEVVIVAGMFLLSRGAAIPRSVFVLDMLMTGGLALAARASFRTLDRVRKRIRTPDGTPVLIYGAASEADLLMQAVQSLAHDLRVVGFLDDDAALRGRYVGGLPVLGTDAQLDGSVAAAGARLVVCGGAMLPAQDLLLRLESLGVRVLRLDAAFVPMSAGAEAPRERPAAPLVRGSLARAS